MRSPLLCLLFAITLALLTLPFGWLAAPALGFALGFALHRRSGFPLLAAVGGMLAWTALLAIGALRGSVIDLAYRLGEVMQLPWMVVVLATLLFPAALAWSAARVGQGVAVSLATRQTRAVGAAPVADQNPMQTEAAAS